MPTSDDYEGTMIGIIGDIRSGKTLLLVFLAFVFSKNREVWSNLKELAHENYHKLSLRDFLNLEKFEHSDVYITELHTWLESRLSSFDDVNLALDNFGLQAGKRDVNIIWDSQIMMSVDVRYRFLADVIFSCNHNKDLKRFEYTRYVKIIIGEPPYQDIRYKYAGVFYLTEEYCEKNLYGKYNTFEIIPHRRLKRMEWALIESDDDLFEVELDKIRSRFAKAIEFEENVSRPRIRTMMDKEKIPPRLESNIYYPLKDRFTYYLEYVE